MYARNDLIQGIGIVENNHCGLPWPVTANGDKICGTVQVGQELYDAITGQWLSAVELERRKNNYNFDYEKKDREYKVWLEKNKRVKLELYNP